MNKLTHDMSKGILFFVVACTLLNGVLSHSGHDHDHRLRNGECKSDDECAYNEECFLELNEEKYIGLCAKPNAEEDLLLLHCKSTADCPTEFDCVSTFDKKRGVCRRRPRLNLEEATVQEEIDLDDGLANIIRTTKKTTSNSLDDEDDYEQDPGVTELHYVSDNIAAILPHDDSVQEDGSNDDHCPIGNIYPVILDKPVVDSVASNSADSVLPKRQLISRTQKRIMEMCDAVRTVSRWQRDCTDPKVRDSYIDVKVNKTLELVHIVFVDKNGEWPSKLKTTYKALTPEDLQHQTAVVNRIFKSTGIQFSSTIITENLHKKSLDSFGRQCYLAVLQKNKTKQQPQKGMKTINET